jgi:hypothetical protein
MAGVDDNDSELQFFVSVGRLCADAHLAGLTVCLSLIDGSRVAGVPEPPPETGGEDELDSTGYVDAVSVGGVTVRLSDVVEASVRRPADHDRRESAHARASLEAQR